MLRYMEGAVWYKALFSSILDHSGEILSQNKGINSNNSELLRLTQFTTAAGVRET